MGTARRAVCVLYSLLLTARLGAWAAAPAGHSQPVHSRAPAAAPPRVKATEPATPDDLLTQAQLARKIMQSCFTSDSGGGYTLASGLVTVDVSSDMAAYEALRRRVWFLNPISNGRASFKLGREPHLNMSRIAAEFHDLLKEAVAASAPPPRIRELADWAFNTNVKWPSPPSFTSVRVMDWPEYQTILLTIGENP